MQNYACKYLLSFIDKFHVVGENMHELWNRNSSFKELDCKEIIPDGLVSLVLHGHCIMYG